MLVSLHLKNCFTHKDRLVTFGRGFTSITGPNEAGKSLILEMVGYALFGSVALRGDAADYKSLYVELCFSVKGQAYRVVRDKSKAALWRGDEELAAGTRPVNAAICRVLGYDYTVYSMANLCAQGQIEALGNMKPADRKRAVDQTVGLNVLDDIARWCGEQVSVHTREAEAIKRFLVAPVCPEKPDGYAPAKKLAKEIEALAAQDRERMGIEAWLLAAPALPERPEPPCAEDADTLQHLVARRTDLALQIKAHKDQADAIPNPTMGEGAIAALESEWAAWHLWQEAQRALAGLEEPQMSLRDIAALEAQWDGHDRWQRRVRLAAHASRCPACDHTWHDGAEWDQVKDAPEVAAPGLSRAALAKARAAHQAWEEAAPVRQRYDGITVCRRPDTPEADLRKARLALADADRKERLMATVGALATQFGALPDRSADLAARQRYEARLAAWEEAKAAHDRWEAERAGKEAALEALRGVPDALALARLRHQRASLYEAALEAYMAALEVFQANEAAHYHALAQAGGWANARRAVADLRGRVKGFLLPSLNKVASLLLAQMTDGRRQSVVVDEDFDVLVDGIALNKLSGSGKAVANLALRVALGLVLTNRVFSVFMGDELDASMDADRAGSTADALTRLTETVGQVIVVSHKQFDADHTVSLGAA